MFTDRFRRLRGFTLVELLVVISIIALLVSLSVPGLRKARVVGQITGSLSNLRAINAGMLMYQGDNKAWPPITLTYRYPSGRVRTTPPDRGRVNQAATGFCLWSAAGGNPDGSWYAYGAGAWDVLAVDRPMNQYVYAGLRFEDPATPSDPDARMDPGDLARTNGKLKVFKDPGDVIGHQESWPSPNRSGRTGFESVGTSYLWQAKWYEQLDSSGTVSPPLFNRATKRLHLAESFVPSRFVWMWDERADIIVYDMNPNARTRNAFGDLNRSVMAYMDGRVAYNEVIPGRSRESYANQSYTVVFDDLVIRR